MQNDIRVTNWEIDFSYVISMISGSAILICEHKQEIDFKAKGCLININE